MAVRERRLNGGLRIEAREAVVLISTRAGFFQGTDVIQPPKIAGNGRQRLRRKVLDNRPALLEMFY